MSVSPTHPCAGSPATAGVYEDVNVSAEIDGLGYMQGTAEAVGWGVGWKRERGRGFIRTATHKQIYKKKKV